MESHNIVYSGTCLISERISYLSEYYSLRSERSCKFTNNINTTKSRESLECYCLEGITHENCHCFSILFPYCWFSTTEDIIIHTRKIIMNQSITMHELNSNESIDGIFRTFFSRNLFICEHRKYRTQSLAPSFNCMTKCIDKIQFYSYNRGRIVICKISRYSIIHPFLICRKPRL